MRSPRRSEPRSTKPSPSTCRLPLPSARRSSTSSSGTTSSRLIGCATSSACTTSTRTARTFGLRAPPRGRAAGGRTRRRPDGREPAPPCGRPARTGRPRWPRDRVGARLRPRGFGFHPKGEGAAERRHRASRRRRDQRARCSVLALRHGDRPDVGEFRGQRGGSEDRGRARHRALRGRWRRAGSGLGMVHDRVRAMVRGTRRGVTHVGRARLWFMLEPPATELRRATSSA